MPNEFYDVMVDIETTGKEPDHSGIIQLAAVKFNLKSQEIDQSSFFDRCMHLPTKRFWDESTRDFWYGKNRQVLNTILPRREQPGEVMKAFSDWVVLGNPGREPLRFWARPAMFDFPFVDSYLKQFDLPNPFHYRHVVDMNSYIRGMGNHPNTELYYRESQGSAHNALIDILNQIGNLFAAVEKLTGDKGDVAV